MIETLLALREETGLSILLVTHNMDVACRLADEIGVMYQGRIIEAGSPEEILHHPKEAYTKKLIDAIPKMQEAGTKNNFMEMQKTAMRCRMSALRLCRESAWG